MQQEQSPFDLKRLALFFLLSMAIFYAWAWFAPKPAPLPPDAASGATGAVAAEEPSGATGPTDAAPPVATPGAMVAAAEPTARRVRVRTPHWDVEVSNVGGRITSWQLLEDKEYGDSTRPVDLVRRRHDPGSGLDTRPSGDDAQDILPLQVKTGDPVADDRILHALHVLDVRREATSTVVEVRWSDGAGLSVDKTLTLRDEPPIATIEAHVVVNGHPRDFALLWGPGIGNHTAGERQNTYFKRGLVAWRADGKVHAADRPDRAEQLPGTDVDWVSLEDSFFTALFVPAAPRDVATAPASATHGYAASGELRQSAAGKVDKKDWPDELVLAVPFTSAKPLQSLYVGPRERTVLTSLDPAFPGDRHLEALIQMGFLQPIAVVMHQVLIWLHGKTGSWGASIVLLTLMIRAALFPVTHISLKRTRKMQDQMKVIKPREKTIRDRFRKMPRTSENRLREQQEIMALYQEVGFSPTAMLSGCLPLLLSMPFFWALFQLLPNAAEFRHEPFLHFWSDLSTADPFHIWPIATAATMFLSSWVSMSSAPTSDPMQRNTLLMLPLFFGWFCWGAPLGLVVYWTISNLIQLAQQYLLNLTLPRTAPSGHAAGKRT